MKTVTTLVFIAFSSILPKVHNAHAADAPCFTTPPGFYACWTHAELDAFVNSSADSFCSASDATSAKSMESFVLISLPYWNGTVVNKDDGVAFRRTDATNRKLCEPYCILPGNRTKGGCELYP